MQDMRMGAPALINEQPGINARSKEHFHEYVQTQVTELQDQISHLEDVSYVGQRQDAIDHCLAGIMRVSDEVADAHDFLLAYDQRTYTQDIKALTERLQSVTSKIKPKSRFHFKTSDTDSATSLNNSAELASKEDLERATVRTAFGSLNEASRTTTPKSPTNERHSNSGVDDLGENFSSISSHAANIKIEGHTGQRIILPSASSHATTSGSLTRLTRCIVDMSASTSSTPIFAALAIRDIKQSLIIVGHVAGAAHITAVENSVVVVASRQVRIHDCKHVDIYLHCASRPIIEDCDDVRFSPLPERYRSPSEDSTLNQWNQVDDFKWIKAEPSPHWSVLPEEQRFGEQVWTKAVPGEPNASSEVILTMLGIVV